MPETNDPPFVPYNEREIARQTSNRLPHWEQDQRAYFVTFRLADALPASLLAQWESERMTWLAHHPKPWSHQVEMEYHKRFSARMDTALDEGGGSCLLRRPELASIVAESLAFFEGERCHQFAWVVMPNHVHVLFSLIGTWELQTLLHSWKSFTTKAINGRIGLEGALWQKDYFDRLIRDGDHFANCVRYIRRNPLKARLRSDEYLHWESGSAANIL